MRKIDKIIIHCSASEWGNAKVIDQWHHERGFNEIGYHYVICNGYPEYKDYKSNIRKNNDGLVEKGRNISIVGAHAVGDNKTSVGICLIGDKDFTEKQINALLNLLYDLVKKYPIGMNIWGHYEVNSGVKQGKTCPNMNMDTLRMQFMNYAILRLYRESQED